MSLDSSGFRKNKLSLIVVGEDWYFKESHYIELAMLGPIFAVSVLRKSEV